MKKITLLLVAALGLLVLLPGCKQKPAIAKFNPSFIPYVAAYTAGPISVADPIEVELTTAIATPEQIGDIVDKEVFSFTPAIEGEVIYSNTHTIRFQPKEPLPGNTLYEVAFALDEVMEVPDSLRSFRFNVKTIQQHIEVSIDGLVSSGEDAGTAQTLKGTVYTTDVIDDAVLEEIFSAAMAGNRLPIEWIHDGSVRTHHFTIPDLQRQEEAQDIIVKWSGAKVGAADDQTLITLPGTTDFTVTAIRKEQEPDQKISIEFSDPLDRSQDLNGLIQVEGYAMQIDREANRVDLFPKQRMVGTVSVSVSAAVRDINGRRLAKPVVEIISFEEIKPAVKLIGNGVIMPQSDGLAFPFEAVNLKAVDVTVIKIYNHNVLQFLQNNTIDERDELKRVGRIVATHTVNLKQANPNHLRQWMRYGLSLEEIIKTEPGAIYHIGLSFKPSYSLYGCGTDAPLEDPEKTMPYMDGDWDKYTRYEYSNWYYYESYFGENYSWSDRDNPCKLAYYNSDRFTGRNVLVSDLGIVAKKSNDGSIVVSVSDLTTTAPVVGAAVTLYNFQQHPMATFQTDSKGQITATLKEKPFVLVAEKSGQKGYLKLHDGVSLSVSRLDVGGVTAEDGLKGFLYAERGVWRPGDSVYLQLMLEDIQGDFPAEYPVSFTLSDPRGQVVHKAVHTPAAPLQYDLRFATDPEAPTGNWTAQVKVGGASFSKRIKIETIKPNRLKVLLEPADVVATNDGAPLPATLSSEWLHGASAGGLTYDVEAQLSPQRSMDIPTYSDYHFVDPANNFSADAEIVAEGTLDEDGTALLSLDLAPASPAPGRLRAALKTRVFEPSGDFSVDRMVVPYDPYNVYVGIKTPKGDRARGMLLTDTLHTVSLVTVSNKGVPVPNRELEVELYQINFSWWWNQADMNQLASYISRQYVSPIQSATVTTNAKGEATWGLQINFPNWGNYLVRVKDAVGGHVTGKTVFLDWPGWAGRGQRENPGGAALLSFSADKEKYAVGEEMTLTIPSGSGGRAWVSLENGQHVVKQFWANTTGEETKVTIKATAEMTPNVYAFVTLIQPHGQTANDVPIRLYGALPLLVEDPATHLQPVIATADAWRPESKASVTVSEATGRPMHYTLAVVDEGLLGLTRFPTPDPWSHFYAREALGVRTFDMYDHVLGAFGGTLEQLLSIGGDGEVAETGANKRANRFTPMVRFLGPFTLPKGKKATHEIDVPAYVGAVRVMVVAGHEHAFGNAEESVKVKKPVMVLATAPRVLSPTETIEVPVSVFAMEDKVKQAKVTITVNDKLQVLGSATKQVAFTQPGDKLVPFEVQVKDNTGDATITVTATSGNESATHTIHIPVRNPNPMTTKSVLAEVNAGSNFAGTLTPFGIAGTNEGLLEVSALPPMNLSSRLDYLIRYPHGCVEQTTSRGLPQLFVKDLVDLSPDQLAKLDQNIKEAIGKLNSFQQPNGGLAYWPGLNTVDDWSTTYAGHFMLLAKEKGYVLPYDFLSKWTSYQKSMARQWKPTKVRGDYGYSTQLIQAYRLYTLALAGSPDMGAMNLLREVEGLSNVAQWRLAAAYAVAGQGEVAKQLTDGLSIAVKPYNNYYTYGSTLRDKAIIAECMAIIGLVDRAEPMIKELADAFFTDRWYSTQTTAYGLLAIATYAKPAGAVNTSFNFAINGKQQSAQHSSLIWQRPFEVGTQPIDWSFTNPSDKKMYVTAYLSGQPPLTTMEPEASGLQITVTYTDRNGNKVDPAIVAQGTDLLASVTVAHAGNDVRYNNLALTHVMPSGWEIANARLDGFADATASAAFDYQDIRDDRILTYFDLNKGDQKTFTYVVNATYKGTFFMPGVQVVAMYDRDVRARESGKWVKVVDMDAETVSMQ